MRNQPPVEVWLAKLSTGACLRRPKAIVVDTEGTQTICDKHGHGSCDLTSCLEVDQLLARRDRFCRTTSIPRRRWPARVKLRMERHGLHAYFARHRLRSTLAPSAPKEPCTAAEEAQRPKSGYAVDRLTYYSSYTKLESEVVN